MNENFIWQDGDIEFIELSEQLKEFDTKHSPGGHEHDQDDHGNWSDGGSDDEDSGESKVSSIKGMPKGSVIKDETIQAALVRGAHDFTAKERVGDFIRPGEVFDVSIRAKQTKDTVEYKARGDGREASLYNPRLATLHTEDVGTVIERTRAVIKPGIETEIKPLDDPDTLYRGMSAEEFEGIQKTGVIQSEGGHNIGDEQIGATFFSPSHRTAESYASGFAPWQYQATFAKPAYVIAIKRPEGVPTVGPNDNEVGIKGNIDKSQIVAVWQGEVYDHTPGTMDLRRIGSTNEFREGSRSSPSSRLAWSKVDAKAKGWLKEFGIKHTPGGHEHDQEDHGNWSDGGSDTDISNSKSPAADLLAKNHDDSLTIEDVKKSISPEFKAEAKKAEEEMKGMEITNIKYVGENGKYIEERSALHRSIIREMFTPDKIAAAVPKTGEKPVLTLSGGRPAAGKTTSLEKELKDKLNNSFYLSADEIQEKLPGYKGRHAALYNGEAQDIALQAEKVARHMGLNIIYDATMKSKQPALDRVLNYKEAGYDVDGYFVHTTPAVSAIRSTDRFMDDKRKDKGRYLPPEASFNNRTSEGTFDSLIPHLRDWALYDNNGAKPVRIAGSK